MIEVRWDEALPNEPSTALARWDGWFAAVGDAQTSEEWAAAREVHRDREMLEAWATIIELNRLDRIAGPSAAETAADGPG